MYIYNKTDFDNIYQEFLKILYEKIQKDFLEISKKEIQLIKFTYDGISFMQKKKDIYLFVGFSTQFNTIYVRVSTPNTRFLEGFVTNWKKENNDKYKFPIANLPNIYNFLLEELKTGWFNFNGVKKREKKELNKLWLCDICETKKEYLYTLYSNYKELFQNYWIENKLTCSHWCEEKEIMDKLNLFQEKENKINQIEKKKKQIEKVKEIIDNKKLEFNLYDISKWNWIHELSFDDWTGIYVNWTLQVEWHSINNKEYAKVVNIGDIQLETEDYISEDIFNEFHKNLKSDNCPLYVSYIIKDWKKLFIYSD